MSEAEHFPFITVRNRLGELARYEVKWMLRGIHFDW